MKKKIVGLMNLWNARTWFPYCLRGVYDFFDEIIITESCWINEPSWLTYKEGDIYSSPDGTASLVRKFIKEEDVEHKVKFHQAGLVRSQPEGRNSGLYLIPNDTDWVMMCNEDEFYMPEDLRLLRKAIEHPGFNKYSNIVVSVRSFYFDFTYYKLESIQLGYRWFPGQRFFAVACMYPGGGETFYTEKLGFFMYHASYVRKDIARIKACIGEDVSADKYRKWWEEVFSKFDGNNLEELYSKNSGGIHVFGGGPLERYYGPLPPVLDNHPLRNWKWGDPMPEF